MPVLKKATNLNDSEIKVHAAPGGAACKESAMKRTITIQIIAAAIILICSHAFADGFIIVPKPGNTGYHYPLAVTRHDVKIDINDDVCLTEIDQEFYNPGNSTMEGIYFFPVPRGAFITQFSMLINGVERQAETLDAKKARGIYEKIVSQMRDPGLMEYADQDLFRLKIYPIEPHSRKRIKISYQEPTNFQDGYCSYIYPLGTEKFSSQPIEEISISATITSGSGISNVLCPGFNADIVRINDSLIKLNYKAGDIRPDRDFRLYYSRTKEAVGISIIANPDGTGGGHFLLNISPDDALYGMEAIQKDVVFVVDTSGSMIGEKLDQVKLSLLKCVSALRHGDHFQIVRFSTEAESLFSGLVPNDKASILKSFKFIDNFHAAGGTNLEEALKLASGQSQSGRPRYIVIITDGRPTIGETDEGILINNFLSSSGKSRIFTFGIGAELNTHLLEGLSSKTGGSARYITGGDSIESVIDKFFNKISLPVMTDINVKFAGSLKISDIEPSSFHDIFAGDMIQIYGKYYSAGKITVAVEGLVGQSRKNFISTFTIGYADRGADFVPRMWARTRIGRLMEKIRLGGADENSTAEIIKLARTYGIITPYTSYLILEDENTRTSLSEGRNDHRTLSAAPSEAIDVMKKKKPIAQGLYSKQGDMSVSAAREIEELKDGHADQYAVTSSSYGKSDEIIKSVKIVNGRAFYRSSWGWIEGVLAGEKQVTTKKIAFMTEEYFRLVEIHPWIAGVLSLGKNIRLRIGNQVLEIYE